MLRKACRYGAGSRRKRVGRALAAIVAACAPAVASGQALPPGIPPYAQLAPINSVTFARRAPLRGQPSYLQTITLIDNGMRYIDPFARFYISPAGEMCFRTFPNLPATLYQSYYKDWCIGPQAVGRVETMVNDVSNINAVRLWCAQADPQCVHRTGYYGPLDDSSRVANSISVETVSSLTQRRALENLVYLMGGNTSPQAR